MPRRIFITVAEVSGDQHAAELIAALRAIDPSLIIEGLGGPRMRSAGATIHKDTVTRAAMSWMAAFRAVEFKRLLKWTGTFYDQHKPDLHICIDSSGVNLYFAKMAHERGVPVMYYIAPQLWASREGRITKVRETVDHVATIWEFEAAYYRDHGVPATYVGHPLFDELPADRLIDPATKYPHRQPIVGILPGSRKSDATHNLPRLLEVASHIAGRFPDVTFHIPTTEATDPIVRQRCAGLKNTRIELNAFDALVPMCDLCITKSGTSTVHVAAYGVPMIVVYYVNPLLWQLAGRWIVKARTFCMVNILAGKYGLADGKLPRLVSEFVPWYGSTAPVAQLAIDLLSDPNRLLSERQRLIELIHHIDKSGAAHNTAKLAIKMIQSAQSPTGA